MAHSRHAMTAETPDKGWTKEKSEAHGFFRTPDRQPQTRQVTVLYVS